MTLPNFLVIGAARSGTTSLHFYLEQHPQIYMCPIKEPSFFAFEERGLDSQQLPRRPRPKAITDIAAYRALFQAVSDQVAIGDVSPVYLIAPRAPERIKHHIPHAKLLAILRDPVERAYSDYLVGVANGRWPIEGFAQEPKRFLEQADRQSSGRRYRYIRTGFYYTNLKRYFDTFDRHQIKIYLYHELCTNILDVLRDIFSFLGTDPAFVPDMSTRYGATGIPKNKILETILDRMRKSPMRPILKPLLPATLRRHVNKLTTSNRTRPPLAPEVRREWVQMYQEDILQLESLIDRDLSAWLEA